MIFVLLQRHPSSYREVHGVDARQLVPLTVKRLGEEEEKGRRRSKLEDNVIDLTDVSDSRSIAFEIIEGHGELRWAYSGQVR